MALQGPLRRGRAPACASKIARTCAAVRAGTSRLSAAANSSTAAAVRGWRVPG